jgi:aminoglycoside phosphotransferase
MQVARKAGLPVPRVICYGDHPDTPHVPVSILMTRLPGQELTQAYKSLSDEDKHLVLQELRDYLEVIRKWKSPWGARVCSLIGTSVRSVRIPNHYAGPLESEQEFNAYLIEPASAGSFESESAYKETLSRAKKMQDMSHRIVFTHGDLKHHNILVQGGRITGFLDWESAGWYPEYWEFTTALRFVRKEF